MLMTIILHSIATVHRIQLHLTPDISRSPFKVTRERHQELAREGEVWVSFVILKCDRSFTFEVVVLYAITCYIVYRYIERVKRFIKHEDPT